MTSFLTGNIKFSPKKIESIARDDEKCAEVANLFYVRDNQPGILRKRKAKHFSYFFGDKIITDIATLERIKKLVIPPAWENVWICKSEKGHLQATGIDAKNRKQYKYHLLWNALRNQTKFYRLHQLGTALPAIRQQLKKDLSLTGLPVEKVLATVVALMEQTSIRIGNEAYEKLYNSYGLTTFKNRHVKVVGDKLEFVFKGKKGIGHNISVKNNRLAKIVKQCRDIPGKELFQYYDADGNHKAIDSGMVNNYLKVISGEDFTAKDFRTWAGTVQSIAGFIELTQCNTATDHNNNITTVINRVAKHLGNTPSVCKKYYVHPTIIRLYENDMLQPYLMKLAAIKKQSKANELSYEESLLMVILEKEDLVSK